jgi:excisionase family DNA binding protein
MIQIIYNKISGSYVPAYLPHTFDSNFKYFNMKKIEFEPIRWLRSKEVRTMLGVSDSTLQTMRIKGVIPAYKLGSSWFYREDEVLAALEAGRTIRKEENHGQP